MVITLYTSASKSIASPFMCWLPLAPFKALLSFWERKNEDIYIKVSTQDTLNIEALDYQIILGENIIITTALAAQTTSNSLTLIIDNLSNDNIPQVDSIVTGPDIKSGVVTTLGAVTAVGTGYTPGVSILATTGAGGGN